MNSQLKTLAEDDLEAAWAVEVERRNTDLDAGMAQPIPLAEALAQLRSTLK